jgi:glutaconate CoA-transferase subunit B
MNYSRSEMMTIAASRALTNDHVCFVGIGLPSAACNLARLTHAPNITLIYESGTIRTRPHVLPLSIGDGELCATALTTVSVPEVFRYWLQAGRINIGFLTGAQIDRFGNLNTTVIGPYEHPKVRLPGGGGAPEIALSCHEVFIIMRQSTKAFVNQLDFLTSLGNVCDGKMREAFGVHTKGPTKLITDLCMMRPDPETLEFIVQSLHPGVSLAEVLGNSSWPVRCAEKIEETPLPTHSKLETLRDLYARTAEVHGTQRKGD